MKREKVNDLIPKIWSIQERLTAIHTALTEIEIVLADEVPDDG